MTTCIVFQFSDLVDIAKCGPSSSRPSQYEIWQFNDSAAKPTDVGMEGKVTYDPTLRKSKSVRNMFLVNPEDLYQMNQLFRKLHIGVGSKHLYEEGDFMKEHFDSRLPDQERLPHIMTLILTRDLAHLKVNGKFLEAPNPNYQTAIYGVLFSLNCPHEVTPVKNKRVSFVFPVFGIYDPIATISKAIKCQKPNLPQSITQFVLDQVDQVVELEEQGQRKDYDLRILLAYVNVLDNHDIHMRTQRLLSLDDSWYSDECQNLKGLLQVSDSPWLKYFYMQNKQRKIAYTQEVDISQLSQQGKQVLSVEGVPAFLNCLLNLQQDIQNLIDQEKEEDEDVQEDEPFPINQPFALVCSGRYYQDHIAPQHLTPVDREIYNRLLHEERKIVFVPVATLPSLPIYYIQRSGTITTKKPSHKIGYTTNIYAEFDDSSSYDARFSLVNGVFLVEA